MEYEGIGFDYRSLIKKKYLLYLIISFASVFFSFVYAEQKYESIKSIQTNIENRQIDIRKVEVFRAQHKDFETHKKRLELEKNEARQILPKQFDEKEFLRTLDECSGPLKIENIKLPLKQDIAEVKNIKSVRIYPIKVQLTGDFYDVLKFVKALEQKHYAINKIKIQSDKVGFLEINLTIGKFILP